VPFSLEPTDGKRLRAGLRQKKVIQGGNFGSAVFPKRFQPDEIDVNVALQKVPEGLTNGKTSL